MNFKGKAAVALLLTWSFFYIKPVLSNSSEATMLKGRVFIITDKGEEIIAKKIKKIELINKDITISEENFLPDGSFYIDLAGRGVLVGQKIKLKVQLDGWSIYAPYNGEFYVPNDFNKDFIDIKLIANKSEVNIDQYSAKFSMENVYILQGIDNYYVQVFASKSLEKAMQIKDFLIQNGYYNVAFKEAYSANRAEGVDDVYKLVIGPYGNRKEALSIRNEIREFDIFRDSYLIP